MLSLHGVTKRYGATSALADFTLELERGRTTALIGPSGCGKSTILRLLMGLLRPDAGSVLFDGQPMLGPAMLGLRRKMGYVVQDGGLFPHLTAESNAALLARYVRWPESKIQARLDELAALVKLPREALRRFPSQLSGGQKQRVSLMRALMLDPSALLLDEPMGALDPMIRSELQEDLKEIFHPLDKTVVLVTHDLGEAAYLADRIVLLRDGKILQSGPFADFLRAPADPFVKAFVRAQRSPLPEAER